MKTADLINALSAELRPVSRRGGAALALPMLLSVIAACALMLLWLGPRDLMQATQTAPFWMKATYTGLLAVCGLALGLRLARPGVSGKTVMLAAGAVLAVMALLGLGQLFATPAEARLALWLGHTWTVCSYKIVVLSLPVLAAMLWFLRSMAPTAPSGAGAAAGLAAGAIGATIYGLHCPETAATFVATWYTLGIAVSAGFGAIIGSRLLRW